jgi:hypothetical protein
MRLQSRGYLCGLREDFKALKSLIFLAQFKFAPPQGRDEVKENCSIFHPGSENQQSKREVKK